MQKKSARIGLEVHPPWPRGFIIRRCLLKLTSDSGSVELFIDVFDIRRPCWPARVLVVIPFQNETQLRFLIFQPRKAKLMTSGSLKLIRFCNRCIHSCCRGAHWQVRGFWAWMAALCGVDLGLFTREIPCLELEWAETPVLNCFWRLSAGLRSAEFGPARAYRPADLCWRLMWATCLQLTAESKAKQTRST